MASNTSSSFIPAMEILSSRIRDNSSNLSWYLQSQGQTDPSLHGVEAKSSRYIDAQSWRHQLKQDALELFRLVSGPQEYMGHLSMNHQYTACLRWLCNFNVFALVPFKGSISYSNISVIASVSEPHLRSVCRMLMTSGVFCEPEPGRVAHTPTSLLLATDPDFAAWARSVSTIKYEASSALAKSSASCWGDQQPTVSGFNVGSGNPVHFQELFRSGSDRDFGGFLKATQRIYANDPVHVLNGFDWASLGRATVVDMGHPASARMSIQLAEKFSDLEMVIVGQSRFTPLIQSELAGVSTDPSSRISCQFSEGPALNFDGKADVIMLRHMLHHFPEQAAVGLLRNLATKLKPNGMILIVDLVLPKPGTANGYDEALLRTRDLIHTELSNGETKDLNGWEALIGKVGGGLRILETTRPTGSDLSFIKVQTVSQNGLNGVNGH